ncbi:MAG: carbohydrate kinase family protein [Acetanaerobacterium sp.]
MSFIAGAGLANCDILFSGMPRVPTEGEEIYASGLDIQMGGGVPATMITLHRLGVPVHLSTFLGTDYFSEVVGKELLKSGIPYTNLHEGNGMPVTATCAIITKKDRTFVSYRDKAPVTDQLLETIYQQSKGAKIVEMHIGYLDVYKKLKEDHVTLLMDTGWEDDLSLEKYADYIELADFYTPSYKEALKITGTTTSDAAINVLSHYFKAPIVKLSRDGCMVMENGKTSVVAPMPHEAVDATGAGDAFLAGLMYGLFYDYSISDSVLFGNITGGACVKGIGCLTSYVNEQELLKTAENITNRSFKRSVSL